ncbi:HAMP domain-containing histidine kinase [Rhodobacteraceae bacterium]|nr:HAMP domain-containing histidine kinase [Paracoccaceae bacterium]
MKTLKLLDFIETPAFALVFPDQGAPIIAFWNARAEATTGLPREDVIGKVPTDVMGALADPMLSRAWIAETGEVRVDGLGVVNLVALPDEKTVIATVLTAAQDVVDKEREVFLGLAVHDARAPLRNIGYLCEELLVDFPELGDGRNKLVRRIRAVADRTLIMTDEVVTSVQAASLQSTTATDVDLQPLCDLIFVTLDPNGRHRLMARGAAINVERPVLQVVLRNLIDNAISHGGRSEALTIEVSVAETSDGQLSVQITDDGKGFSDASLAFFADGEVRRGSGFGLYGVKRLIDSRGGQLRVARAPTGTGSVVTVTLPGHVLVSTDQVARAS